MERLKLDTDGTEEARAKEIDGVRAGKLDLNERWGSYWKLPENVSLSMTHAILLLKLTIT